MAVEVDIPNRDHLLKPGMFARVSLVVDEHPDMITVPTSAILSDNEGTYVFLASNDKARRVPVNIGIEQDERTEILKGLSGNENIITTGQQFVKDGDPVSVQPD